MKYYYLHRKIRYTKWNWVISRYFTYGITLFSIIISLNWGKLQIANSISLGKPVLKVKTETVLVYAMKTSIRQHITMIDTFAKQYWLTIFLNQWRKSNCNIFLLIISILSTGFVLFMGYTTRANSFSS